MPVYEYVCTRCGHAFEELTKSMTEVLPDRCPACQAPAVAKKLSVFSARQAASVSADIPLGGGCARCGDPNGPCSAQ